MSSHFNILTGQVVLSEHLLPAGNKQYYDVYKGELVYSDLLIPRLGGGNLFADAVLDLQFAETKSLVNQVDNSYPVEFSRASVGTYVDADGIVQTSRLNTLLQSQDLANAVWIASNATMSSSAVADPMGGDGAFALNPGTTASVAHNCAQSVSGLTVGDTITISAYMQALDKQWAYVWPGGDVEAGSGGIYFFDLENGVTGDSPSGGVPAIEDVGNGWYRCSVQVAAAGAGNISVKLGPGRSSSAHTFAGNGLDSILLYGPQLEVGSTASDYIPTTSTPSGAPRFTHDPISKESLGLLIEESRTNVAHGSGQVGGAEWLTGNARGTITLNAATAPDGTTTATSYIETTEAGSKYLAQAAATTSGDQVVASTWAKLPPANIEKRYFGLRLPEITFGAGVAAVFDLVGTGTATVLVAGTNTSAGIEAYADGWYRCWISSEVTTDGSATIQYRLSNSPTSATPGYVGDGVSGLCLWGAQTETSAISLPSSYIETTSASVTRAADLATIDGTNFSDFYNQSEGTLFTEANVVNSPRSDIATLVQISDNTGGVNAIRALAYVDSVDVQVYTGSALQASLDAGQRVNRVATAYKANDFALSGDGGTPATDSSGTPPTVTDLKIGRRTDGSRYLNSTIKRLSYFPTRKSNEELEELSTPEDLFETSTLDLQLADTKSLVNQADNSYPVTFTRASSGTYVNSNGLIETSKINGLIYSEDYSQTWATVRVTPTTGVEVAPDGTTSASVLTESVDTGASSHYLQQIPSAFIQGVEHTISVYMKAIDRSWGFIWLNSTWDTAEKNFFDLENGVVGTSPNSGTIEDVGNGWYRCSVTGTPTGSSPRVRVGPAGANWHNYQGQGLDAIATWGTQVNEGSTASTYVKTEAVATAAPRFTHDPVSGESLGLLIEEARTNIVTYSQDMDNWVSSGITVLPDQALAPDGTMTADFLQEGTNSGNKRINVTPAEAYVDDTEYVFSVYMKAGSRDYGVLWFNNSFAANGTCIFDLSNGTVAQDNVGTAMIEDAGNGWYRCSASAVPTAGTSNFRVTLSKNSTGINYQGDGVSGIYAWGAQIEQASTATSYIKTEATSVTRAADVATIDGASFSGFYNETEGTFYSEISESTLRNTDEFYTAFVSDGTTDEVHILITNVHTDYRVKSGNVEVATLDASSSSIRKLAAAYQVNDFAASGDGGTTVTDSAGALPVGVNQMEIGGRTGSSFHVNGPIKRIAYFPVRKPNNVLEDLTS